ncbi:MAG: hypothetical protein GOV00_02295, partial [Candidatus Altiarchaeota archaeon]|nr:hypothetical protein [Candidatus Altiarchaeota archaeon]
MQEIKNKIRVAAAALAGGLMLGATMAGAFAANLSELPAPFVVNNNMAGQIVVGASATVPDVIAAAQISAALGQYMVSASSASGASTTREYKQEETAIDAVISTTLGTTLTDTAVSKLLDKQISFRSTNYDIHEAIILGGSTPLLVTGLDDSSMSSIRDADEYGSSVGAKAYLRVGESDIEYRYIFDDTLNGSATATLIDTDHPLKVNLMGQSISIVDIVDDDSITVQMGVTGSLGDGETIAVGDFVVTVETIATSSVALRVTGTGCASGGDSDFVSNGGTWDTACGGNVQVEVEDLLYVDADSPSNRVKLRVGEETTKTYNQGNNFLNEDEDDNDPGWKWTISATDGVINHVGAYYARSITSLEDEPITVGGSIALPYDYAVVKLVSYNTETRAT